MLARFMSNFRKPRGLVGSMVVRMMNKGHAPMTRAVVERLDIGGDEVILDIGCGGGMAIKMMAEKAASVYGIDISEVSVARALETNSQAVRENRVQVTASDVLGMPFKDDTFSLVTAFETVYFWDEIGDCFERIHRAVKPGGRFAVTVEAWTLPDGGNNFPKFFSAVKPNLYSPEELSGMLHRAGFPRTSIMENEAEHWLCVVGWKGENA